jgi:hypothetical protein
MRGAGSRGRICAYLDTKGETRTQTIAKSNQLSPASTLPSKTLPQKVRDSSLYSIDIWGQNLGSKDVN